MPSSNNNELISKASPHTIKKFELIETYVKSWAQKLMLTEFCNGLIFIDCMCNSGVYHDEKGEEVIGTPIRIANILRDVAGQYPNKCVQIFFNDRDETKIDLLKTRLPADHRNFTITTSSIDGNLLLKQIGSQLQANNHLHFFLLYDPYDASIDWEALAPFFRNWGEVLINHMISDPIRALSQVKSDKAKKKYMDTYLIDDVEKLIPFGSNKSAYEDRLTQIITALKGKRNRRYFIAAFPFFNTRNALIYDLVHCTSHIKGFQLFKKSAWDTFGKKSSNKNVGYSGQLELCLTEDGNGYSVDTHTDESCYFVKDIAKYVQQHFAGRKDVLYSEIWELLDEHPIFPGDGCRNEIKRILVSDYGAIKHKSTMTFKDGRG